MTLHQLKYVIAIAEKGSFNQAAQGLFISQPSLSHAIKELEAEIKINIFNRTNRGVKPSEDGAEFIGYARQVLDQFSLLEEKYATMSHKKQLFSVSAQHYTFVVNAFIEVVKKCGSSQYEFAFRETGTREVIDDVRTLRSEIGIIYLTVDIEKVIRKFLDRCNLVFNELFSTGLHVFVYKGHPAIKNGQIALSDLEAYPCLSYERESNNSFYFSEDILNQPVVPRRLTVTDRASAYSMMVELHAYEISTGILNGYLCGKDIIAIPLDVDCRICVGTIMHKAVHPSVAALRFIDSLKQATADIV